MATEIERKFLVQSDDWRDHVRASERFEQAYLCGRGPASVRVRVAGEAANINVKAARIGTTRSEYEYPIPLADARAMMAEISLGTPVVKTRHWVEHAGHTWEIDVFEGDNAPLVVAEVELDAADERVAHPDWLGAEITEDKRYYNHALAFSPYAHWDRKTPAAQPRIEINLRRQTLTLLDPDGDEIKRYRVSTAAKGAGEYQHSNKTPRGRHRVRARIGADAPPGTVFVGRRPTGEIYSLELARAQPKRDWILSRILWLSGEEVGVNRLGAVDSMRRFIYIHGAADNATMGRPGSAGCIRMTNSDVIDLFERVPAGTSVVIHE